MISFLVDKLHDAHFMTMLLAAIAVSATAYTLIMPLFAGEGLSKRMKAVASERERIRARERDRLNKTEKVSLRQTPKQIVSKVLRDRKKMAEKIQAMSMEAKASAGIIGSLPPIVMLLVYMTTPDYISLLWTHPTGQLMLVGCVIWMSMGILVMKKMINFDF